MRCRTLQTGITCSGIGLHSGRKVDILLEKATRQVPPFDPATRTIRTLPSRNVFWDISSKTEYNHYHINVNPTRVCDTTLSTTVMATNMDGTKFSVSTIEHLMAALWAFKLTDVNMSVTANEIPIFDGSSKVWCDKMSSAEIKYLEVDVDPIIIYDTIRVEDGDSFLEVTPCDDFSVDISIDFPYRSIGRQRYNSIVNSAIFKDELSFCRTFVHVNDVVHLKMMGKALGGSLDNAIVVDDNRVLNENGLRVKDEFVKHKVLDLIGDLWTLGRPIVGKITGYKPSHRINNLLARKLYDMYTITN